MVILDLKKALSERGEATLPELVFALRAERTIVRAAIEYWVQRGRIKVVESEKNVHASAPGGAPGQESASCGLDSAGGCSGCGIATLCFIPTIHYRWIEPASAIPASADR